MDETRGIAERACAGGLAEPLARGRVHGRQAGRETEGLREALSPSPWAVARRAGGAAQPWRRSEGRLVGLVERWGGV